MSNPTRPPLADREVLLDAWVAKRAEIGRLEAEAADLLATRAALFDQDVASHPVHRDMARRSMVAEYTAAGRTGSGTVENAFAQAEALTRYFPGLHTALRHGTVSIDHVRAIISAADPVRDAVRNLRIDRDAFTTYEQACIAVAEQDSPTRTRVAARQLATVIAGETLRERHQRAIDERCVTVRPLDEGMALLTAVLPEIYAIAIKDRLGRLAKEITSASRPVPTDLAPDSAAFDSTDLIHSGGSFAIDPEKRHRHDDPDGAPACRTRVQIEADVLTDLLLASDPSRVFGTGLGSIHATVQVTVAATTLAGEDDHLAELDGYGPLDPDLARDLGGHAVGWNRLFLDSAGMVTKVDRYTPTDAMKRFLRARDQRCRFPGCQAQARRCEIDHNHDYAKGGQTEIANVTRS